MPRLSERLFPTVSVVYIEGFENNEWLRVLFAVLRVLTSGCK